MGIVAVQKSVLPEESPDKTIFSKSKIRNWKTRFKNFLNKEGAYAFCKMAKEIKGKPEKFVEDKYNRSKEDTYKLCEEVFAAELEGITIDQFLKSASSNTNFNANPHRIKKKK